MAPPNDNDDLKKQQEELDKTGEAYKNYVKTIDDSNEKVKDSNKKLSDAEKQQNNDRLDDLDKQSTKIKEVTQDHIDANNTLKNIFSGSGLSKIIDSDIANVAKAYGGLKLIGEGIKFTSPLAEEGIASAIVKKELPGVLELLKDYHKINNAVRQSVLMLNDGQVDFKKSLKDYPQILADVSSSTGESRKTLNDLATTVGKIIPDSFKFGETNLEKYGISIKGLTSPIFTATTALRAFGLSAEQSGSKIIESYTKFGQKPEEYMLSLGKMQQAAQATGISNEIAMKQITDASSSFAIFGRGADEAANLWAKFSKTLKEGGVPIEQTGQMLASLTQGLAGMSLQNRALIGMMSGITQGSSAIGGALKLEFAMRSEGGMEKNLDALTQTLAKFTGGKIITLEQAVQIPQLEQQFVMQRQLLGQLTGITGTEQQNRMLEVLQGVNTGGLSQLDAQKGLKEVMSAGKSLQEQMVDGITSLDQNISKFLTRTTSDIVQETIIKTTGLGAPGREERAVTALKRSADIGLSGTRDKETELITRTSMISKNIIESGKNLATSLQGVDKQLLSIASTFGKGIKIALGEMKGERGKELQMAEMPARATEEMKFNEEIAPKTPKMEISNFAEKRKEMLPFTEITGEETNERKMEKTTIKNIIPTESTLTINFVGDNEKIIKVVKNELQKILTNTTTANYGAE